MDGDADCLIAQLVDMGFIEAKARRAVMVTGCAGLEAAAGWIIDHGDEDGEMPAERREAEEASGRPPSDSFVFVNDDLKLVLLVRKDLAMSPGKVAAQCAHAALGSFREASQNAPGPLAQWQAAGEAIIVLGVESVEEMSDLEAKAKGLGICTHVVRDAGRTEVEPSTLTVAALGPTAVSQIDSVTGHLSLL